MKSYLYTFVFCMAFVSASQAGDKVYTFGIVPQFDARHIQKVWRPILDELEKETGEKFRIEGSPTIPAFESQFTQDKFDFAYMNPYHALVAAELKQYQPLVRDVGRKLYGIIVVSKNSGITSISQLDGKTVAFPAPNALGASLIPRAEFKRDFNINIQPKYVQSHSSVYLNVILGRAAAGGGVQKSLSQQKENIKGKLKVIHKTPEFSPHPIVVHKRIPKEIKQKVRSALLSLGMHETGKKLIAKIPIKEIGPADVADYLPIKKLGLEEFYVK